MIILMDKLFRMAQYGWHKYITVAALKKKMKSCGADVTIDLYPQITPNMLSIGNHVYLGPNTRIICTGAQVQIGSHVMFGPGVTVVTGNHRVDYVGKYLIDVKAQDKLPENDQPVIFEGDNWIGANATILKGVTVGEGAVVAAGAVVTKNVAPYTLVGGVPAKYIGDRFKPEELAQHRQLLGNQAAR